MPLTDLLDTSLQDLLFTFGKILMRYSYELEEKPFEDGMEKSIFAQPLAMRSKSFQDMIDICTDKNIKAHLEYFLLIIDTIQALLDKEEELSDDERDYMSNTLFIFLYTYQNLFDRSYKKHGNAPLSFVFKSKDKKETPINLSALQVADQEFTPFGAYLRNHLFVFNTINFSRLGLTINKLIEQYEGIKKKMSEKNISLAAARSQNAQQRKHIQTLTQQSQSSTQRVKDAFVELNVSICAKLNAFQLLIQPQPRNLYQYAPITGPLPPPPRQERSHSAESKQASIRPRATFSLTVFPPEPASPTTERKESASQSQASAENSTASGFASSASDETNTVTTTTTTTL